MPKKGETVVARYKKGETPNKGGRPSIPITDKDRKTIRAAAGYGLTNAQVAVLVGMAQRTLERSCAAELSSGRVEASAQVQQTAFTMAMSGKVPAMTIFWLKVRCGWKESSTVSHTGPDGGAIQHEHSDREAKLADLMARVNARSAVKPPRTPERNGR